jgi:ankyrin repeat protein
MSQHSNDILVSNIFFSFSLIHYSYFKLDYPSKTHLLHISARKNDSLSIRLLIKNYKARINVFDEDGCTPLHISCYEDNIEALKALLEYDADFQKGTRLNPLETPVSICVKYQHDSCLQALFELTPNFNWKRYFSQLPRSPLLCDFPSIYAIELLVEHSLDINTYDERGNTFVHYLVNKKDIDYEKYVEKLIEKSADFNRQNQLGRTPFLEALEQNNFQLLAIFLRHIDITNINVVDTCLNTALHYCKYLDQKFIYDSVLTANPLSLNAQNRDGQTPLHDAIICDNYLFAQYLLQHDCNVSLKNKDGNTPIHLVARDDNVRMCKLLMKYEQLDLTVTNKMGKTPLHLACANEKANVAAILINKLNIEQLNLLDVQGRTPLHECAENINGTLAKYLIRHGADENAKDIRENTILHLTTEKGIIIESSRMSDIDRQE